MIKRPVCSFTLLISLEDGNTISGTFMISITKTQTPAKNRTTCLSNIRLPWDLFLGASPSALPTRCARRGRIACSRIFHAYHMQISDATSNLLAGLNLERCNPVHSVIIDCYFFRHEGFRQKCHRSPPQILTRLSLLQCFLPKQIYADSSITRQLDQQNLIIEAALEPPFGPLVVHEALAPPAV